MTIRMSKLNETYTTTFIELCVLSMDRNIFSDVSLGNVNRVLILHSFFSVQCYFNKNFIAINRKFVFRITLRAYDVKNQINKILNGGFVMYVRLENSNRNK